MTYLPDAGRYQNRSEAWFRRCGQSGLKLPAISMGCWHNFGAPGTDTRRHADEASMHANAQQMLFTAFDLGITHFDLANNYGPPPGSAESRVGRILKQDFAGYRDELIISSKAGYHMWDGPYGDWGSRKYLIASCDASLKRLGLDYVDIFYSHRPDPETPIYETMGALDSLVRAGKALYTGISNYSAEMSAEVVKVCRESGFVLPIIHQPRYNLMDRWIEKPTFEDGSANGKVSLLDVCDDYGLGVIPFCPLAQGLLTPKYLNGVPDESRASHEDGFLTADRVTPELVTKLKALHAIAESRGQSLAQMALAWVLRKPTVTSALIGASRAEQIVQCCEAAQAEPFSEDELAQIDAVLA